MSEDAYTTLGVSAVLRGLGVKGGRLPGINVDRYTPVVVMGDFSRTLTSEPLESRGVAAEYLSAVGGQYGTVQLQVVAGGGAIIESCRLAAPTWGGGSAHFKGGVYTSGGLVAGAACNTLELGGASVRSLATFGTSAAVLGAGYATFPLTGEVTGGAAATDLSILRWYVPAGAFLMLQCGTTFEEFAFMVSWREIPEPVGSP